MNILTDEEIISIENTTASRSYNDHARAIEAAVLSKLAEQAREPVADVVWFDPALELFTERRPHKIIDGSLAFMDTAELGTKLYTEVQLIAAQQRTAEACAKLCEAGRSEDGEGQHRAWYAGFDMCIDAIRNGDWREYL